MNLFCIKTYFISISTIANMFITKLVTNIIQKFGKKDQKVLGRWTIDYCDKKMNHKIDLSNEDHCGPCGQYILDKTISVPNVKKNT
jgi:hypothetical protein